MKLLIFSAGILGASLFTMASILGGVQIEGYSMIGQYISESYAAGLPNTDYLRYMFIANGMLLASFGFMAPSQMPKSVGIKVGFFMFAIFYGFGTVMTGFFPCDIGCNPNIEEASLSQFIHNTAGFLAYTITPFCIMGIGLALKGTTESARLSLIAIVCGVLSFAFVLLLFRNPTGPYIGLFQRVIEGSILFWVVTSAFYILKK